MRVGRHRDVAAEDYSNMTTKLEGPLRREVDVDGAAYTLTITPQGLALVPKGRRKGHELSWTALVSGDAALATALNASLHVRPAEPPGEKSKPVPPRVKR